MKDFNHKTFIKALNSVLALKDLILYPSDKIGVENIGEAQALSNMINTVEATVRQQESRILELNKNHLRKSIFRLIGKSNCGYQQVMSLRRDIKHYGYAYWDRMECKRIHPIDIVKVTCKQTKEVTFIDRNKYDLD